MVVHVGATWRIRLRSVRGSDAVFRTNYFRRLFSVKTRVTDIVSRPDSGPLFPGTRTAAAAAAAAAAGLQAMHHSAGARRASINGRAPPRPPGDAADWSTATRRPRATPGDRHDVGVHSRSVSVGATCEISRHATLRTQAAHRSRAAAGVLLRSAYDRKHLSVYSALQPPPPPPRHWM